MIVIFGGAFNPPTLAHFEIAEKLISKFKPDDFYFLPVGNRYKNKTMLEFNYRYDMVKIMADKLGIKVSNLENEDTYRGTYYALKYFSKDDPDVYFVMGADNFDYLDEWINAQNLVKEFKFIILSRAGFDINKISESKFSDYKDHFVLVEYNNYISASLYRKTKNHELIIPEVRKYIEEKNLYEVK
jgi:nicotinate-nucleotide adenylyltransferase